MKKYMVALLAGMLLLGFAASAMAEVAINGSYRARLWYANNYDLNGDLDNDDPQTFIDNRLRLLIDVKVADGVNVFANVDATERRFGGVAADVNNQNFQVNEGYLKFFIPATPVMIQVGRQDVSWYYGVLGALSDYRDRIKFNVALKNLGINFGAAMDQTYESLSTADHPDDDDATGYSAWFKYAIAGWDLGLLGAFADNKIHDTNIPATTAAKNEHHDQTYLLGIGANGVAGPVKIGFEAATRFGHTETRLVGSTAAFTKTDVSGFGVLAIGSMPAGPVGVSLALAYATGDDVTTTDENEGFTFDGDGPFNGVILWANNWAPEIAPQAGNYAADKGFSNGFGAKLGATFSPVKPLTLGVAALYAVANEDPNTKVDAGPYGAEFDLTCSYDIAPSVNVLLAGGYLMPGSMLDDLGYEDSALGGMLKFEVKF